jgi:hypothetical protein
MDAVSLSSLEGPAGRAVFGIERLGIEGVELVLVDVGTALVLVEGLLGLGSQAYVSVGQLLVFFIVHGSIIPSPGTVVKNRLLVIGGYDVEGTFWGRVEAIGRHGLDGRKRT